MKTRSYKKSKNNETRKLHTSRDIAGRPIAAGGFGCVFKPPIKCKKVNLREKQNKKDYVSKLMKKRYAREEMGENTRVKRIILNIPNNEKYFLLNNIFKCDPNNLEAEDLIDFNNKCRNMGNMGITKSNVNNNLGKLSLINIPYGGEALSDYISDLKKSLHTKNGKLRFYHLNNMLIELLENAIIPMNKLGLIHNDLKADNILVEKVDGGKAGVSMKIIDWGLSGVSKMKERESPIQAVRDRPFQFNVPFGVILFNNINNLITKFKKDQKIAYKDKDSIVPLNSLKQLATYIIHYCQYYAGSGHSTYIFYDLRKLTKPFSSSEISGSDNVTANCYKYGIFTSTYVIDYIADILKNFVKGGMFDEKAYFDIYRHNVDIWGFLTCYKDLIETTPAKKYLKKNLMLKLSNLVFKYLYSTEYASKKIPVKELISHLHDLNKVVGFKTKIKPTKKAKKSKMKIVLRPPSNNREISIPAGKKRCPNGYVKNKATGKCRKKGTKKADSSRKRQIKTIGKGKYSLFMENGSALHKAKDKTRKRCPTGYRKVRIENGYLICKKKK